MREQAPKDLNRVLERSLGVVVAMLMFAMMMLIIVDVVGRYAFESPLPGGYELTELIMGVLVFAALPLATGRDEQIAISIFSNVFIGAVGAAQRNLVAVVSVVALGGLTWRLWVQAARLEIVGTTSMFLEVPLYPVVYAMMACTAASTAIVLILMVVRVVDWRARRTGADRGE